MTLIIIIISVVLRLHCFSFQYPVLLAYLVVGGDLWHTGSIAVRLYHGIFNEAAQGN